MKVENLMKELKNNVKKEKKAVRELMILYKQLIKLKGISERKMMASQVEKLKKNLHETNERAIKNIKAMYLSKPIKKISEKKEIKKPETKAPAAKTPVTKPAPPKTVLSKTPVKYPVSREEIKIPEEINLQKRKKLIKLDKNLKLEGLEKETLKRLKKREKSTVKTKKIKPKKFAKRANRMFSRVSMKMVHKKAFRGMERDLIKANMQYTPTTYISLIYYGAFLSFFAGILLTAFFVFFKVTAELPIITLMTDDILGRFLKLFWIMLIVPLVTFLIMYFYPSLEKKSTGNRIEHELPFATINMAAISGSLIDPSKIFNIIITTKEYPYLSREFTKIINEINIHGYNFVSALRNASFNSPSKRLSELFSGLATTINSGGDLPNFFEERSKSLLFEHRLEREKQSKTAETFMDIYISLVVAAPMILMLLLIMMKISGLGISFSTNTITIIMVLAVSIINILFLTFLHVKKE